MQHLLTLFDLSADDVTAILDRAATLKAATQSGAREPLCAGLVMTQVFEKPSLRTRVSFAAAMSQLGGQSIFLTGKEAGLEGRESNEDIARVLGGYSDVIVLRTFAQSLIELFATHSGCHVINGLSDAFHPCQALTDLLTVREARGTLAGLHLAYVGDGNNVARSLAIACALTGMKFSIAAPEGYELEEDFIKKVVSKCPSASLEQHNDPFAAVAGADVVYTDVWASMGQEAEKDTRARTFASYQVNTKLLDAAGSDVIFMHCLPARRGQEVSAEVMEDRRSLVFEQAENRMHLAKGLIAWLLGR